MARTYARLAAVAAVAAGVVLSAGAGAAVADTDSHDGKTTNEQANSGSSGNSGGKNSSGKSGGKDGASGGSRKSDKSGNSSGSGNGSGGKDHSASRTQSGTHSSPGTDATDTSEGNSNGTGTGTGEVEGNSNGNGSSNSSEGGNSGDTETAGTGNGSNDGSSVDDSSSSPTSTETPATPTVEQPATTATAAATPTPTATATTVPIAPANGPTPTRVTNNDTFTSTPPAPGAHPSAASRPGRTPAASLPGSGAGGRSAGDAAALSTRWVSDRDGAGKPTDGATPNSARGWLTKVGNEFIESVTTALREVTLKDLALAALPGIAGLIFVFTTGIGLGHRQAKFGFLMETTGALRFAARGPLGVVRSGGFIAVRARKAATRGSAGSAAVDRAA